MRRFKWIVVVLVLALLVIVVFQNLELTKVHLLFWTVGLPGAALITITLAIGFLLGLSASTLWKVHVWRVRAAHAKKDAHDGAEKA